MALRNIRKYGDEILRKNSKEVKEIDKRTKTLIEDMGETMYANEGVGLAAPQVGVLKRIVVVDVGDGLTCLVNPVILEQKGSDVDVEGCLSIPNKQGKVARPTWIKVKSLDKDGKEVEFEAEDYFARAICHEVDHLDGILYIDKLVKEEE